MRRGVTCPSHGAKNVVFGVVGRQTPGAGGASKVIGALRPSFCRSAMKWSAARSPYRSPCSLAGPSGIAASDAA
jgi:hypothetical protein